MFTRKISNVVSAGIIGLILTVSSATCAVPNLTTGVWTDLTPSFLKGTTYRTATCSIDQSNHNTLYLTGSFQSQLGLLKSTDRGSTWVRVGNPPAQPNYGDTVDYLDGPFQVEVDPANSQHIYCTEMSPGDGPTWGFWVTWNGGAKWVRTKGFMDAVAGSTGSIDAGHFSVDPTDFNHVLLAFHSAGNGASVSPIFETKDGGTSFVVHSPVAGMQGESKAIGFLFDPGLGIGNKDTWLMVEDQAGMWRTTDDGTTWTEVWGMGASEWTPHGGTNDIYYTPQKVLYINTFSGLRRSSDNGKTWETVPGAPSSGGYTLTGDGQTVYTGFPNTNSAGVPWYAMTISNGSWSTYAAAALPQDGASHMTYDTINHIVYSANTTAGFWALKVDGTSTATVHKALSGSDRTQMASNRTLLTVAGLRTIALNGATVAYDIRGRLLDRKDLGKQPVILRR